MTEQAEGDLATRMRFLRITPATKAVLRDLWQLVEPQLPAILDSFYEHVASEPRLQTLVAGKVPALKRAQTTHWRRLFAGNFDTEYSDSVHTIGLMHHRIGLEPRWYIGGYAFVLDRLTDIAIGDGRWSPRRLRATVAALTASVMLDMDIAISVYQEALLIERERRGRKIDALLRQFEIKTGDLVGVVAAAAGQLRATAQTLSATTDETTRQVSNVAAAVEQASVNVQTVAAAAEELHRSIAEISRQVAQSTSIAMTAVEDAHRTDEIVKAQASGALRIGDVVGLINSNRRADQSAYQIRRRTRLNQRVIPVQLAAYPGTTLDSVALAGDVLGQIAPNRLPVVEPGDVFDESSVAPPTSRHRSDVASAIAPTLGEYILGPGGAPWATYDSGFCRSHGNGTKSLTNFVSAQASAK